MATTNLRIATDSATELHNLIGDDAIATFESDPKFIDADPTESASSGNIAVQRDTDDTEDSAEEEDELADNDEFEDDEDEDEDEEDGEAFEDEDGVTAVAAAGLSGPRGSDTDAGVSADREADVDADEDVEYVRIEADDGDSASTERAVDAALRMSAMVAVVSAFAAANV